MKNVNIAQPINNHDFMKRHLILAALLTIGAANLNAASPKKTAPEQKGVETINRATAEAHIEFLA